MKKPVFLWALYDFANSIVMIVFLFYFSQWLVVDSGKPDWWFNATLIVSSLLYLVTAPVAAQRLDVTRRKLAGIRVASVLMFVFYLATALVVLLAPSHAALAAVLFTIAMYLYLMNFVYYTPMINDVSTAANRGWISGIGQGANYAGQVFGLLVTLPFATGALTLFGAPGRGQALLPCVLLSLLFAAPLLLRYKDTPAATPVAPLNVRREYAAIWHTVKTVFSIRNLALLFLAYFIFSDALLTFANNFPIFLEKVFQASDEIKTYLSAGILTLAAVGSILFGKIADKKGNKPTLLFLLAFWILFFPALAFAPSLTVASILCLVAGVFFGPVWSVSRSMVAEYTPPHLEARSFGFYTLAERFATFIGPITWSVVLAATAGSGNKSYSYALVGMGVLVLLSLAVVKKMRNV